MSLCPWRRSRPVVRRPYLMASARGTRERKAEEKGITLMNTTRKNAPGRKLLSVREAAWALGVDQSVVCRAIRQGVLPLVKRRRQAVVPVAAVTRLLRHARARDPMDSCNDDGHGGHAEGQPTGGGAQ